MTRRRLGRAGRQGGAGQSPCDWRLMKSRREFLQAGAAAAAFGLIRQKPASFNLDDVMRSLSEPQGMGK